MATRAVVGRAHLETFGDGISDENASALVNAAYDDFTRQFPVGMVPMRVTVRVVVTADAL